MNLPIPEEPTDVREDLKKGLERGGGRMNPARATIKQGAWLTSPLWSGWKDELKKNGITWPKFEELYRNCSHHFISWVEESLSWNEAVKNFIKEIKREVERASLR